MAYLVLTFRKRKFVKFVMCIRIINVKINEWQIIFNGIKIEECHKYLKTHVKVLNNPFKSNIDI